MMNIKPKSVAGAAFLSYLLLSMFSYYGCSHSEGTPGEGHIIYQVSLEGDDVDPMMKTMMPSEITTYYKGNQTATIISMGMGMMETRMISDAAARTYSTLISAMGKKVAMVMNGQQVDQSFSGRAPLNVRYTDEVKEIAGVKCRQAMITDSTDNSYPVYYTDELGKSAFNWSTPYKEIEGMLMEYSIRFDNIVMKLTAKEIVHEPADSAVFTVPNDYEKITDPDQMELLF
ncbi:MAG TPA: hypothetical protein VFW78_06080 [Bacteroidia bacterium]|nr:hypothetical protein [Bacteroidia bacterium]